MTLRENLGLLIVGILGCTLLLQRCNKPLSTIKGPAQISFKNGGNTLVVTQPHGQPLEVYQPDPKSTIITTDEKGNVTVKIRQFGVGFEPGLGVGYSDKLRLAVDFRFVFFKRFSGHTGLAIATDPEVYKIHSPLLNMFDAYLGVGYVPFLSFPNTSLVASFTATKHVFVFMRFRF